MNIIIDGYKLSTPGGLPRWNCALATALTERKHTVFLFTTDISLPPFYPLHESVVQIGYTYDGDQRDLDAFRKQIKKCKPDICLSPYSSNRHLLWCAALWDSGIPWIYSEHGAPNAIDTVTWNRTERLAAMSGADRIHLLLPEYLSSIPEIFHNRACIIPNPVWLDGVLQNNIQHSEDEKIILSMGRLDLFKQNALLVEAFALLAQDFPEWKVEIRGDGPERQRLEKQVRSYKLEDKVHLPGATKSPEIYYKKAQIFCIPSKFEGLSLSTAEAMAMGLPVVGFAECSGTNQIVKHGQTGLLAEKMTSQCLAECLRKLMIDTNLRTTMGAQGQAEAQQFTPSRVYDAWEELLKETVGCKSQVRMNDIYIKRALPDELPYLKNLKICAHRRHVYLLKDDWLHIFAWRHQWLRKIYIFLRHCLKKVFFIHKKQGIS